MREWLVSIRKDMGLTQTAVAKSAGIAQPSYFEIEHNTVNPTVKTAKAIAATLGFDWTRFYEDGGSVNERKGQ